MLTPVDLQQKKFQHGMGYTKKDVDSFFDIVVMSYTELYKSNAELTNQVKTLTDSSLQNNRIEASEITYACREECRRSYEECK